MSAGKVIVYGGRGALGAAIVKHFKANNWWVLSIQLAVKTNPKKTVEEWVGSIDLAANEEADANIAVSKDANWSAQSATVMSGLESALGSDKVDAIINVAGGWAGGNASNKDFLKNCELMWAQSVWSSTISAQAAATFLKDGGLLALPGAQPALKGTAGMMGYGLAKAAVHQLTKSLGCDNNGLPSGATAVAILPITLDTPNNRKWMANSDFSKWTTLEFVAQLFEKWIKGVDRPASGSLVQLITNDNKTELVIE